MKRLVTLCSPSHECSDEEIKAIIQNQYDILNDPAIKQYDNPTLIQMETILAEAEVYSGEWYHSYVILHSDALKTPEEKALINQINNLPEEKGIALAHSYEVDMETELHLRKIFTQ